MPGDQLGALMSCLQSVQGGGEGWSECVCVCVRERERDNSGKFQSSIAYIRGEVLVDNGVG